MPLDLRQALRNLARNPGFSAVVILILAGGIGANTAMFSIADGILLRPLPFERPQQLFAIQEVIPRFAQQAPTLPVSAFHFREWQTQWHAWEAMAIFNVYSANLTSGGEPQHVNIGRASAGLFPLLGLQPRIGRSFTVEEDQDGRDKVVVLGDSLWRRHFHADPAIVGQKILLDGVPFEVLGVLPRGLEIPKVSQLQSMRFGDVDPDLWKPLAIREQDLSPMGDMNYACIARLKRGYSASQALDELNAIQDGIVKKYVSGPMELRASLVPLQAQITSRTRQGLLLLLGAVGAVLLIVCVNIANLMLTRATARKREFSIRAALGASPARLLRQMMTESFLIAAFGGILGAGLAYAALHVIVAIAPSDLPRMNEVRIDGRALSMALLLSLASALLFGLLPAWRGARSNPQEGLKSGGRSSTDGRNSASVRSLLVALEVALSTVCLVAAGLLLNSFVRLMHVDKGFTAERITTVNVSLPATRYPGLPQRAEFVRKMLDQVKTLPGVTTAAVTNFIPLTGEGNNNIISPEGTQQINNPTADQRWISEDFFHLMDIALIRGRFFEPADRARNVAVISAQTAERLWPHENPLGKKFRLGGPERPLNEVIGVVADVKSAGLQKSSSFTAYLPYWQRDQRDTSLLVRAAMDPASVTGAVRAVIHALDPELPVPQFRTMQEIVSASVAQRRFQLTLVMLFAAAGLILACLGIYGVVSYSVEQRRGELGIRMALGATASNLQSMVLRQGLTPVLIGLATGIAAAMAMGQILRGLLFGVNLADPLTLGGVAVVLLTVAALACYLPASRATGIDPLTALRSE